MRLAQVIGNILNNAAKYTEEGGHIWLSASSAGGEVVLRVRDSGVGIQPDLLPRVFDLFTQADRALDRSQGGLGIGLTLVRNLVEMHGGSVEALSAGSGHGSEFVIHLPVALQEKERVEIKVAENFNRTAQSVSLRILVVDDNLDSAESLALLLQFGGHDVRMAHEGQAALDTAVAFLPHVVVLDIGLPKMDGYEVARRLRQQPAIMNSSLVALTGYGQDEDRQRSKDAGFDHHLVKPVDPTELQALLEVIACNGRV